MPWGKEESPHLPEELTTVLQAGDDVRIERIVSMGHRSPEGFWYDQDHHKWVVVLTGAVKLEFGDRTVSMAQGDSILIPAHAPHRVLLEHRRGAHRLAGDLLRPKVSKPGQGIVPDEACALKFTS